MYLCNSTLEFIGCDALARVGSLIYTVDINALKSTRLSFQHYEYSQYSSTVAACHSLVYSTPSFLSSYRLVITFSGFTLRRLHFCDAHKHERSASRE